MSVRNVKLVIDMVGGYVILNNDRFWHIADRQI